MKTDLSQRYPCMKEKFEHPLENKELTVRLNILYDCQGQIYSMHNGHDNTLILQRSGKGKYEPDIISHARVFERGCPKVELYIKRDIEQGVVCGIRRYSLTDESVSNCLENVNLTRRVLTYQCQNEYPRRDGLGNVDFFQKKEESDL